jgi:hypothetical protein
MADLDIEIEPTRQLCVAAAVTEIATYGPSSRDGSSVEPWCHTSSRRCVSDSGETMEKKRWTLIAAGTGVLMLLLDVTIVNVALPDIGRQLHASPSDLQGVIDAYALSLLLIAAGIAFACATIALTLIRQQDFVDASRAALDQLLDAALAPSPAQ